MLWEETEIDALCGLKKKNMCSTKVRVCQVFGGTRYIFGINLRKEGYLYY